MYKTKPVFLIPKQNTKIHMVIASSVKKGEKTHGFCHCCCWKVESCLAGRKRGKKQVNMLKGILNLTDYLL